MHALKSTTHSYSKQCTKSNPSAQEKSKCSFFIAFHSIDKKCEFNGWVEWKETFLCNAVNKFYCLWNKGLCLYAHILHISKCYYSYHFSSSRTLHYCCVVWKCILFTVIISVKERNVASAWLALTLLCILGHLPLPVVIALLFLWLQISSAIWSEDKLHFIVLLHFPSHHHQHQPNRHYMSFPCLDHEERSNNVRRVSEVHYILGPLQITNHACFIRPNTLDR